MDEFNDSTFPESEEWELAGLELELQRSAEANERLRREGKAVERKSQSLEEMQRSLKAVVEVSRRQVEEIARVTRRFLPPSFPAAAGLAFAANCKPCADVGGDFYDVFPLPDGRVAICMADVSGHGTVAAVAMATTRALLRAAVCEAPPRDGPSDILMKLSRWIRNQLDIDQFVTMWLGVWDGDRGELSFCSAAHPAAVVWPRHQGPRFLHATCGTPLGLASIDPIPGEEKSIPLGVGDRVFLYTDGWNESASAEGDYLEDESFLDFLSNSYGQPLDQVPGILFMEFDRHAANSRVRDDVSLLVLQRSE